MYLNSHSSNMSCPLEPHIVIFTFKFMLSTNKMLTGCIENFWILFWFWTKKVSRLSAKYNCLLITCYHLIITVELGLKVHGTHSVVHPSYLQCVFEVVHEKDNGDSTAAASALPGNYQDTRAHVDVWTWKQKIDEHIIAIIAISALSSQSNKWDYIYL